MNRKYLIGSVLALLTASVSLFLVSGAEKPKPEQPAKPGSGCKGCCAPAEGGASCGQAGPAKKSAADRLLAQLTAVLDETNSPDTLLLTVMLLGEMGPKARPVVPAVLRSLERVGLCKDFVTKPDRAGDQGELFEVIMASLQNIVRKKGPPAEPGQAERRFQLHGPRTPACVGQQGPPAIYYSAPPAPTYGLPAPACVPCTPSQPAVPPAPPGPATASDIVQ